MYYYEVMVASQRFHGDGALTYGSDTQLSVGTIVQVALQRQVVLGLVTAEVKKPVFAVKNVVKELAISPLPDELIRLIEWLRDYYPAPLGQILTLVLPGGLGQKSRKLEKSKKEVRTVELPPLTPEQQNVYSAVSNSKDRTHLLYGDTGTGKTRLYLELIKDVFEAERSVLLLTPEIGLTSQLADTVEKTFPGQTIVLHSGLTTAQRRARWQEVANSTRPLVVIGPRSTLFAPLHDIGLIILDEAHDSSYKQEQAPYYQASRVAAKLGELHEAKVLFGTATPLITDYYTFEQKKLPIHRMTRLANPSIHTSQTHIIDLKNKNNLSRSGWLSTLLLEDIENTLGENAQILLFLNRRGSARVVLCQNCGWQSLCPNCDVTLTYHADSHLMQCHSCGHKETAPSSCPVCHAAEIVFKSVGTKTITGEVERLFPSAKVLRLDSDNTKAERLENQYDAIKKGEVDIIVGTQVVAKGLDLPKLGLVGVILADTGLNFPDFTAEERSFQLISQVMGRVNRGHRDTKVIVQTFNPDNTTIQFATKRDFDGFYASQIEERKLFLFPPFTYLLKLRIERASSRSAETAANALARNLKSQNLGIRVSEPSPAFIEKLQGRHRWQITIKSNNRKRLVEVVRQLPSGVYHDLDPSDLL